MMVNDGLPDLSKAAIQKNQKPKTDDRAKIASVVDDELAKLGWSENARLSFLGDMGRENAWNRETIFNGHLDPKNKALNRGIISWQGDRLKNLDGRLRQKNLYGRGDDEELREMVRFMDDEMRSSGEWEAVHQAVRNPNLTTYEISENLRKYIKYVPIAPYNSFDKDFRVQNNRIWAEKAKSLGLGRLPDLSQAAGEQPAAESSLPDLSEVTVSQNQSLEPQFVATGDANRPQQPQPTFPNQSVPSSLTDDVQLGAPEEAKKGLLEYRQKVSDELARAKTPARRGILIERIKKIDEDLRAADRRAKAEKNVSPAEEPLVSHHALEEARRRIFENTELGRQYTDYRRARSLDGTTPAPDTNELRNEFNQTLRQAADFNFEENRSTDQRAPATVAVRQKPADQSKAAAASQTDLTRDYEQRLIYQGEKTEARFKEFVRRETARILLEKVPGATGADVEAVVDSAKYWGNYNPANQTARITVPAALMKSVAEARDKRITGKKAIIASALAGGGDLSKLPLDELAENGIYIGDFVQAMTSGDEIFSKAREIGNQVKQLQKEYETAGYLPPVARAKALFETGQMTREQQDEIINREQQAFESEKSRLLETMKLAEYSGNLYSPEEKSDAALKKAIAEEMQAEGVESIAELLEKREHERKLSIESWKRVASSPGATVTEFSKNLVRTLPKSISAVAKTLSILSEGAENLATNDVAGGIASTLLDDEVAPATERAFYGFGKWLDRKTDEWLPQDELLKRNFLATTLPDTLGQLLVQLGAGAATGGLAAPLLLGATQGAASQYEEAARFKAESGTRLLSALVGGLAAVPDAIPFAKWLAPLSAAEKSGFVSRLLNSFFGKAAAEVGDREAQTLTRQLAKNVLEGGALEGLQEVTENKINDALAAMTYDPKRKVLTVDGKDIESFVAGFFGGAAGGAVETAGEVSGVRPAVDTIDINRQMVEEFLAKAKAAESDKSSEKKSIIVEPVKEDIKPEAGKTEAAAAEAVPYIEQTVKELVRPIEKTETLTGKTVVDAQNLRGTVIEDKGNAAVVDWENGTRSIRSRKKLQVVESEAINEPAQTETQPVDDVAQTASETSTEPVQKVESDNREPEKQVHEFASTQFNLPKESADKVQALGKKMIPDEALYTDPSDPSYGRETESHITARWGIETDAEIDKLRELLKNEKPFTVKLGRVSIFEAKGDTPYDVVKLDVESDDLHRINKLISDNLKVKETFPYSPHATLAYVPAGEGKKYAGHSELEGEEVTFDTLYFSSKTGEKIAVPLGDSATNEPSSVTKPESSPGKQNVAFTTSDGRSIHFQDFESFVLKNGSSVTAVQIQREFRLRPSETMQVVKRLNDLMGTVVRPESPAVTSPSHEKTQEKSAPQAKTVTVGDREVTLTPEQAARWEEEVEKPLAAGKRRRDQAIAQNPINRQRAEEEYKGMAMRIAAVKREITGLLTEKEQAAKEKREKSNYIGKEVSVDNRAAKVTGNPFGKVKVQFEDGTEKTVEPEKIQDVRPKQPRTRATNPEIRNSKLYKEARAAAVELFGPKTGLKSIVGERAILSPKIRADLRTAMEMEASGAVADTVFLATGWERGIDGRWRYDLIDDVSIDKQKLREMLNEGTSARLQDTFNSPQLFEAYPQLKEIVVKWDRQKSNAYYDSETKTIGLNPKWKTVQNIALYFNRNGGLKFDLVHEVQHAIQQIEGFPSGESSMVAERDFDEYWKKVGEVEARNAEKRVEMSPEERRQLPISATEDVPRAEQRVSDASLKKTVPTRSDEHAEYQELLKEMAKSDILPEVESNVINDEVKLSLEAAEIVRLANASVEKIPIDASPAIAGQFLDESDVTNMLTALTALADGIEATGGDPSSIDKLIDDIQAASELNGTVILNVYADAMPHERIHQLRYLNAARQVIRERYHDFDAVFNFKFTDSDISLNEKAYENFYKENYFHGKEFSELTDTERAALHEEVFASIAEGEYARIGFSIEEAAAFLETDMDAYIAKNGKQLLNDLERWIHEKIADFQIIEFFDEREETSQEPARSDGSLQGEEIGQGPESSRESAGTDSGRTGSDEGKLKTRQTVLSAEESGVVEKNSITGPARYYTVKSRDANKRAAQEMIERDGLATALWNAKNPPDKISPEYSAYQMEVVELLNRQADEALKAENTALAAAKLGEAQEIVAVLAERSTDLGQAISQLAAWQKTDPKAVTGYVQKRRNQNQYHEALRPEEASSLREAAEEFQKQKARVAELEAEIKKLEEKLAAKSVLKIEKKIREKLETAANEAIARLKEKLAPGKTPLKSVSALKSVSLAERVASPLDSDVLRDFVAVGANILNSQKGKPVSIADFNLTMTDLFGPDIKPHLPEILALSETELKRIKSEIYRQRAVEALQAVEGNQDLTIDDLNALVDKQIAERKERARIRAERKKAADRFFKEQEKFDELDDLPSFAKSLFKVADTSNKEVLVGALYLETGQVKSADELARKLRKTFPNLTPREALNTASLAARSRKLALEDLKKEREAIREKISKVKKAVGSAKADRNHAQRQLLNRIRFLENEPPSYSQRIGRVYKAALVSAVQTTVNNFLMAQATRKLETLTDITELFINRGLNRVGVKLREDAIAPETRISDVLGYIETNKNIIEAIGEKAINSVFARATASMTLDEFPTFYESLFGSYASDIAVMREQTGARGRADWLMQKVETTYEYANYLNYLQEFLVRSQEFNRALQMRLGAKGQKLKEIVERGETHKIAEDDLKFAVDRALRVTFARSPERNSVSDKLLNLYLKHVPGLLAPFGITFPKFLYNAASFITDYAPGVGLLKAGYVNKKQMNSGYLKGLANLTTRQASYQLIGSALFLVALGLVRMAGDDDKWYYLKLPVAGTDGKNYYIDVRGYQPFAASIFLANKFNRLLNGQTVFSDKEKAVSEILEAMVGLSTRNLTENKIVSLVYYAAWGEDDGSDWERVSYLFRQQLGEIGGGFLRPLKTVKDFVAQFDDYEAKQPDLIDHPGLQGLSRSVPFGNRLMNVAFDVEPKKNFVTGKESEQPAPGLKILGVSVVNPDYHKEIPSKALVLMRDITNNFKKNKDPLPESQRKMQIKADLNRVMAEAGDDPEKQKTVLEAIRRAEESGILEKGELDFIERKKGLTELESLAKRAKLKDLDRVYKIASDAEKSVLDPIIADKKENEQKEAEKQALDKIVKDVRGGKTTFEKADKELTRLMEEGKITERVYRQRVEPMQMTDIEEEAKKLDASSSADFRIIEEFVKAVPAAERENVYNILLEKAAGKTKSKDEKSLKEAEKLLEIIEKYFSDFEKQQSKRPSTQQPINFVGF